MMDLILYVCAMLVVLIILSPVMLVFLYMSIFLLAITWLLIIYGIIGLPWYLGRAIQRFIRSKFTK